MQRAWAGMLVLAALTGLAGGPVPRAARGEQGLRRLVASMDFEGFEASGQDLPKGWYKTSLPGGLFPHYVTGRLSREQAHGGEWSFAMALDGANVAYEYTETLTVHPSNDYLLTGYVRVRGLRAARAQARLFFVDAAREPIPGAVAVSEPLGEPGGPADGAWQAFAVKLQGDWPAAASVRVLLSVVQPRIWQGDACRDVYEEDIRAQVWWDDIAVYRLPRIDLRTGVPGNVFFPQMPPRLHLTLDGVDWSDPGGVLTVRSAEGRVRLRVVEIDPSRSRNELTIPLPDLEPGLYDAELAISAAGSILSREHCRFVCLPEAPRTGKSRLGLDGTAAPRRHWADLLIIARAVQASQLKLPAWPRAQDLAELPPEPHAPADALDAPARQMQTMLSRMNRLGMAPVLAFAELPPEMLTAARPAGMVLDSFAAAEAALRQAVELTVARHGTQVAAWQVAGTMDPSLMWSTQLPRAHATARGWLEHLLVRPAVMVGWNATFDYDMPMDAPLALVVPPEALPEYLPAQLENFRGRIHHVHLQPQPETTERLGRLADLAMRYAYVRAGGVESVCLDPPWRLSTKGTVEPTELLLVARTLAAWLGDAEYVGMIRLDASAVGLAFRKSDGEGLLLVHGRPSAQDDHAGREVRLDLPASAVAVDLWGRRTPLPRRHGQAVLNPGTLPVILAGCDARHLALHASLQLTPEVLPSTYQQHSVALQFTNPYDQPVTGQVRLAGPEGWTIAPRVARFNLAPGETFRQTLSVTFPYNAPAGLKQFDVAVDIDARQAWNLRAPTFFHLALEDVAFDAIQSVGADGALEVQAVVTNRTDRALSYYCFVQVPGEPRQTRVVQDLAPGATAVKLFRFPNIARLRGQTLRAGLREVAGAALLNHSAVIR